MDGRIDGQFVIKQGGITQGIAQELGLSSAECKQMGSVWNQVIEELKNPNNYIIENNGNNQNNQNKNLTVQIGAVVKFTQECWQRIVGLVNDTLHKNIEVATPNTGSNTQIGNKLHREQYTPTSYADIPNQDQFNTRDARGLNIETLKLTEEQLLNLTIDDTTVLSKEQTVIVEKAKRNTLDAGLNISTLHQKGITGKGIRIAIIDSAITNNPQFSERILYNKNFAANIEPSAYHGNAISSVAVGKDCGVAPEAELAFYSVNTCEEYTKSIEDVISQNEIYKQNGEPTISVISISCGFDLCEDYEQNYGKLREAITNAKKAGIAIITCDDKEEYKHFAGADRNPLSDPNNVNSYRADRFHRDGDWWNEKTNEEKDQTIFIPAEHRTVADDDKGLRYEGAFGGASWTAPYIAGVYALAKQVKPNITYEQFIEVMQKTADNLHNYDNSQYVGKLINPKGIIDYLQNMN